jgi:DNA-binding NtrC family response regulator
MNYQELLRSPIIPPQIATLIQKAVNNFVPVLIQGEQGTGKEWIAKIIHYEGDWKDYHFYKLDCRILVEDSFRIQLSNLLKETNYGTIPATLYLEEIGSMGHNSQLMLSELIEDGMWRDSNEKKMVRNIRLIASSSENLKEKVVQRKFSEDLYHQLCTFSIFVPPLRDRVKEISTIAQFMLEEESKKMGIKRVEISNDILKLLESYWWPGNLRELDQMMRRSVIFSNGGNLLSKDLCFNT